MKSGKYLLWISIILSIINWYVSKFVLNSCVQNSGIAFGISFPLVEVFSIALFAFLVGTSFLMQGISKYILLGIAILGSGNLILRFVYGYICDYISLLGISFNLVDIGIVSFVIFGILIFVLEKYENKR